MFPQELKQALVDHKKELIDAIADSSLLPAIGVLEAIDSLKKKTDEELVVLFSDVTMIHKVMANVIIGMICVAEELNEREEDDSKEN